MTNEKPSRAVTTADAYVPEIVVDLATMRQRFETLRTFITDLMVEGQDFGWPSDANVSDEQRRRTPPLLKPGAEKLCNLFGLAIDEVVLERREEWDPPEGMNAAQAERWEPVFQYEVKVELRRIDNGLLVATGIGSCNSRESKYRWRSGGPACPDCEKPLRLSNRDPEWYCWQRQGGCGATFPTADHPTWSMGRVKNADIFDQVNTIRKMASKRALVDATLKATRASGFFTQDIDEQMGIVDPGPAPAPAEASQPRQERAQGASAPANGQQRGQAAKDPKLGRFANIGEFMTQATGKLRFKPQDIFSTFNCVRASEILANVENLDVAWERLQVLAEELREIEQTGKPAAGVDPDVAEGEFTEADPEDEHDPGPLPEREPTSIEAMRDEIAAKRSAEKPSDDGAAQPRLDE